MPTAVDKFKEALDDISDCHDRLLTLLKAAHTAISRDNLELTKRSIELVEDIQNRIFQISFLWMELY